jgi:hypothetical protein
LTIWLLPVSATTLAGRQLEITAGLLPLVAKVRRFTDQVVGLKNEDGHGSQGILVEEDEALDVDGTRLLRGRIAR